MRREHQEQNARKMNEGDELLLLLLGLRLRLAQRSCCDCCSALHEQAGRQAGRKGTEWNE